VLRRTTTGHAEDAEEHAVLIEGGKRD
jgi:hypothetical protein